MNKYLEVPFVDLAAQYAEIQEAVDDAMKNVVRKTNFILGDDVQHFEEEFATYCDVDHAVGIDSGTSALELLLRAYDIGPGDEVITVANTFIATTLAITFVGARPVLVDADPRTYNIDVSLIEQAITSQTRAIMPVHLYGQPADMDPILEIAKRHNLLVIEDACQAHGAWYKNRRAGSLGHAAAFSFYPGKNLGAYGDGGMAVTNDAQVAERLCALRNYGSTQKYHHPVIGYNRRLDTLQAAVLRVKLQYLDEWNAARRAHAQHYHTLLDSTRITLPEEAAFATSVHHLYVIQLAGEISELQANWREHGIATGIHYPVPVHLQPAYEHLGYLRGDFPVTEQLAARMVSLPMFAEMTEQQVEHVATAVNTYAQVPAVPERILQTA